MNIFVLCTQEVGSEHYEYTIVTRSFFTVIKSAGSKQDKLLDTVNSYKFLIECDTKR